MKVTWLRLFVCVSVGDHVLGRTFFDSPLNSFQKLPIELSYVREREREKVHCKCTMYCIVHFIITLFNVGNVLLCVIYQLNFTVFMYVKRISRYVMLYIAFGIIAVSRNCSRSWNALPVDKVVRLCVCVCVYIYMTCCQSFPVFSLNRKTMTRNEQSVCQV